MPGYGDMSFNVVKKCSGEINVTTKHSCNLSQENGTFPEKMKITKVTLLFTNGNSENFTNYTISIFPCFCKVFL